MYECKKCSHKVGTIGGIRGHIWAKHRNKGKNKKPIHKGVDFVLVDVLTEPVADEKCQGLDWVGSKVLARIVEGDIDDNGKLGDAGRIALEELRKRDPTHRTE